MTDSKKKGGLYVVELCHAADVWIKVGQAQNLASRIIGLQTACPIEYSRVYVASLPGSDSRDIAERSAHMALHSRVHRGEWFHGEADEATLALIAVWCGLQGVEIEWERYERVTPPRERSAEQLKKALIRAHHDSIRTKDQEGRNGRDIAETRRRFRQERTMDALHVRDVYLGTVEKPEES